MQRFPAGLSLAPCVFAVAALAAGLPAQALTLSVGSGPDCDFPTVRAAFDAIAPTEPLELLLQGRGAVPGQGIHDVSGLAFVLDGGRQLRIRGDAGEGLSPCSSRDAAAPPRFVQGAAPIPGYLFQVRDESALQLENLELRGFQNGALQVTGGSNLVLDRVTLRSNRTPPGVSGAAIQLDAGSVEIIDSLLRDNDSGGAGGAVFCSAGASAAAEVVLTGAVRFETNRAAADGGAIMLHRRCTLRDEAGQGVVFRANSAARDGGAIAADAVPAVDERNAVRLQSEPLFEGNFAGRHGGALAAGVRNVVTITAGALFGGNEASQEGGALALRGEAQLTELSGSFVSNVARRGGAAWIDGRNVRFLGSGRSVHESARDSYSDSFIANRATGSPSLTATGGALFVTGAGTTTVERYEFRENDVLTAGGVGGRGAVAATTGSGAGLRILSSLLWRNGHDDPDPGDSLQEDTTAIELMGTGNTLDFVLSTVVEQRGAEFLSLRSTTSARLIGVVAAQNRAGQNGIFVAAGATITGSVCNNVHIGPPPPPLDPGFVPAPGTRRGQFRLGDDSPLRARCPLGELDGVRDAFVKFDTDLDGIERRVTVVGREERIDSGAFGYTRPLQATAACAGRDLVVEVDGDRQLSFSGFVIAGEGPSMPRPLTGDSSRFEGPGAWRDVFVRETAGDFEQLGLGTFVCGTTLLFRDGFDPPLAGD
jgi:predicted outer membrane repeat protein